MTGSSKHVRAFLAFFSLLLLILPLAASTVVASSSSDDEKTWEVKTSKTKLPYAVYRAASVWTGDKEYIISGRTDNDQVDTIIEFDPSTEKAVVKNARVPTARIMAGAAWLSPYAYIFGGQNLSTILDDVLRYDPRADKVEVMPYKMPFPRVGLTAIAVDDSILVMGGRNESDYVSSVLRFYPDNGTFIKLPPTPIKGGGRTGVYTGYEVFLFGSCINVKNQAVLDLDPATGISRRVDIGTERGFYWASSAWTGKTALIFGGNDYNTTLDQLLEYTSKGDAKGELKDIGRLPQPIENSAAFYYSKSGKAYLLGGRSTTKGSDVIYMIGPKGSISSTDVTAEKALLVLGVMCFVMLVVGLQSHFQHPDRDAGELENKAPKPIHFTKSTKPPEKDRKR